MDDAALQDVLVDASEILSSSLTYERTLSAVARLLVPAVADWCVMRVRDGRTSEGKAQFTVRVAAASLQKRRLLQKVLQRFPLDLRSENPAAIVMRTGKPIVVLDVPADWHERVGSDGEHRRLVERLDSRSVIVVPLRARGKATGTITLVQSESGRVFGEQDIALANELARRAALAIENARLYGEAKRAVRARDDLLAAVSHDLRNPLAAIKGQAQLLRRQLTRRPPPTLEALETRSNTIVTNTETMARMIDELVDMAHLQIGQQLELDLDLIDLREVIWAAVNQAQAATEEHRIIVDMGSHDDGASLTGWWDAVRLERVLANLLGNAVKYSPGGGDINVRVRRVGEARAPFAEIEIVDCGLGISRRDLPYIFKQFRRVRRDDHRRIPGAGIGLATVRQIVQQHGGTVTVASETCRGTTFVVRLPLRARGGGRQRIRLAG